MAGTGLELLTTFDFAAGFFFPAAADFLAVGDLFADGFLSILAPFRVDPAFSFRTILLFFATGFSRYKSVIAAEGIRK
jgi:hypothetical protein